MALPRLNPLALAAAAVAFLATAAALTLLNGPATVPAGSPGSAVAGRSSAERIQALEAEVRRRPERTAAYNLLGEAYLQRSRETGDSGFQDRAEQVFELALARDPRDAAALTGMGAVAASRHDFRTALDFGRRARRAAPQAVRPYGVVVDSLIELGRYEAAGRALQQMVDMKPNLASYARVSYYRELHGDLSGAVEAMSLAASAGGEAAEQVAYVQTLLGDLQLDRGAPHAATAAYRLALARLPGYVDARFGLARAELRAGEVRRARARLAGVVADRPDADHLALLAEVELQLGRSGRARRHIERAIATEAAALRAGAKPDAGAVLLEADYGSPARAVRLGRRMWRAAPSVTSADALGWALTRAGRPREGYAYAMRALELGSRYASFHLHAAGAARGAGKPTAARRHLKRAGGIDPGVSLPSGMRAGTG
ncbi:MAG TPA: tetratricopeptide repeat protein [Thermoleophilaceae bacterium]|nr:tetratricopeptide repeat protein [Thermoleophilaceae bacterium]